jgi:CheY-like chemotaxis protein
VLAGLVAAAVVAGSDPGAAQEAAKGPPAQPKELFQQVRANIREGKFDLAAVYLRAFVASDPTDPQLLELEGQYGTTAFKELRAVRRWSDNQEVEKQAVADVNAVIAKAEAATAKLLRTPERVAKYVRNLGATVEERDFAIQELRRTGDYAVPFMVDALRANASPALTSGILEAIPTQDAASIAGWVAALDGLSPEVQYAVLARIGNRGDITDLTTKAQTDVRPRLWYAYGKADTLPSLREYAKAAIDRLDRGVDVERVNPADRLVGLTLPFANHKAAYATPAEDPKAGTPAVVPVWEWDVKQEKLVKQPAVPTPRADEYFGLRYARWALDISRDAAAKAEADAVEERLRTGKSADPVVDRERLQILRHREQVGHPRAVEIILTLAAETAMERGNFGDLARTDPAVYRLLTDAPSVTLNDLLDRAYREKRTALVLALVQVLGDRADRAAATPRRGSRRTSLFEEGLTYDSPRVQFAAAIALLRSPAPLDNKVRAEIMRVLTREAKGDPGVPGGAKGQALLVDPDRRRADDTAVLLRQLGYDVEVFGTGRDLLRRVARASDFDLFVIDRHVPQPQLRDLVSHLRADANAARRPILVVASSDQPIAPSFDQLVLRFALLVAATEPVTIAMPPPYVPDPRKTPEVDAADRKQVQEARDAAFRTTLKTRAERLQRVLDTSGIELNSDQRFLLKLRVEQITWAVLAAEFPLTPLSAPGAYLAYETVSRQIGVQPSVPEYTRRLGLDHLMTMASRFEQDVDRAPAARARFEALRAGVDPDRLGLVVRPPRDLLAEAEAVKLVGQYDRVRVIPEPYSRTWFEADVNAAFADPADRPRPPAE